MEQNVFTRIFEINYRGSRVLFAALTAVLLTISVRAQVPEMMSYQAVIRDAGNELVTSQEVGMQITILQGSANGNAVYMETHAAATNANGLVSIEIGKGNIVLGSFPAINWSEGPYFIRTETDPSGGVDYTITGVSQLLSVPYALHSGSSDALTGVITESQIIDLQNYLTTETDPLFSAWDRSTGIEITSDQVSDLQDYLLDETDPLFTASPAAVIENTDIADWSEAYSWGNHADEGYLTSESDPLFNASPASDIEQGDIENWDEAYSWGDHSQEGYLTDYTVTEEDVTSHQEALQITEQQITDLQDYLIEETDPLFAAWDRSTGILITEDQITDLQAYLTEIPAGSLPGEMMYWNGSAWVAVEPGQYAQTLNFCNGVPTWGPCPASVPAVITGSVTNITPTSATGGGTVVSQGSASVTSRGIVWSTSLNPTTQTNEGQLGLGSGTGSFSGNMTGLSDGTEYFVRAYAVNSEGTAYGNQISFTTEGQTVFPPTVTTDAITDITMSSATSGGNIPDDGGAAITAKGIVWHNSSMPSVDDGQHLGMTSEGIGDESFVSNITGLEPNTQYYVRAYAINSQGVAYGEQRIFITLQDMSLPTVTTAEVTDITQTTAKSGGEVTDSGNGDVLARGVCWSTEKNPTLDDFYVESGTGPGAFESNITGLILGQTYYVRAFATNASGRAYGNQVTFSALAGMPDVVIKSKITSAGEITIVADVTFDGGADITDRGLVWDTEDNPTLEDNLGSASEGTGTGEFTSVITGLTPNTLYYITAYATNSEGTTYSESVYIHYWDYHGTVSDIDGNVYNTVIIGEQEWMAEDLKVTSYSNNVTIYNLENATDWANTSSGAYVWNNNNIDWKEAYGALYNWYAVIYHAGLCPAGWRVPTEVDWNELINYLGGTSVASRKLKSTRTHPDPHPRWDSPNTGATNESGFSALPGGQRRANGHFDSPGYFSNWWTSTESSTTSARSRQISSWDDYIYNNNDNKNTGNAVRCIKD